MHSNRFENDWHFDSVWQAFEQQENLLCFSSSFYFSFSTLIVRLRSHTCIKERLSFLINYMGPKHEIQFFLLLFLLNFFFSITSKLLIYNGFCEICWSMCKCQPESNHWKKINILCAGVLSKYILLTLGTASVLFKND